MKKLIGIFCFLSVVFLTTPVRTNAYEGCWYRITSDDVIFFTHPVDHDGYKLFLLEKTYYLYALSETDGFLQIQLFDNQNGFVKVVGYVQKSQVEKCNQQPDLPHYPTETLNVKQSNAILKAKPNANAQDIAVCLVGQSVNFYGRAWQSDDWYYVKYQNDFGYVHKKQLSTLLIATHPSPLPEESTPTISPPQSDLTQPEQETTDNITGEIILILLVCIPAITIVVLMFVPQKTKQKNRVPVPKYMSEKDVFDDLDLL